ncbi:MAG TPA: aspartate carbamoyltransferase catalytic subunit [bacterium]|nr:aspartate carbamoyltransferase catalytic subunit [bacterium]
MKFERSDLLGLEDLERGEIETILEAADSFVEISERPIKKVPVLRGLTVVNLFFEPSTRTRTSFELAEKRLSADMVNIAASTSSAVKGETLKDTARNIEAMSIDMLVVRHSASGAPHFLAGALACPVVNAGDGAHEHPTQALLDLYTVREKVGRFDGLRVGIVGDILHSRVARSNIWGFSKLGAAVAVCGPATLIPPGIETMGVEVSHDIDQLLPTLDILIILRIQTERLSQCFFPTLREYAELFGIDSARMARAKKDLIVMHPGPLNRGVEITPDVADGPNSVILDQVKYGVAVRMAVLYLLSGGETTHETAD